MQNKPWFGSFIYYTQTWAFLQILSYRFSDRNCKKFLQILSYSCISILQSSLPTIKIRLLTNTIKVTKWRFTVNTCFVYVCVHTARLDNFARAFACIIFVELSHLEFWRRQNWTSLESCAIIFVKLFRAHFFITFVVWKNKIEFSQKSAKNDRIQLTFPIFLHTKKHENVWRFLKQQTSKVWQKNCDENNLRQNSYKVQNSKQFSNL